MTNEDAIEFVAEYVFLRFKRIELAAIYASLIEAGCSDSVRELVRMAAYDLAVVPKHDLELTLSTWIVHTHYHALMSPRELFIAARVIAAKYTYFQDLTRTELHQLAAADADVLGIEPISRPLPDPQVVIPILN